MRVEDACRPGLFTVDIDDSLEVAAHRMDQAQLGALAVVDGQRLVGIVTERGLVRAIARAADPADVPVAAYASSSPQTASVEQDARAVVQRMLVLGVRHLPVTSSDGQLIGMVSMRDLLAVEAWAWQGRLPWTLFAEPTCSAWRWGGTDHVFRCSCPPIAPGARWSRPRSG
jgi:CBS domain-containing protein